MSRTTTKIIHRALELVKPQFKLPLHHGEHGLKHWVRVWVNAEMLCQHYEVDPTVPCWFAFLHDSKRENEGQDPEHGWRAAAFASFHHRYLGLNEQALYELRHALMMHSAGLTLAGIHERICWDADRLDLGRVDIYPNPRYLCTDHARKPEVIEAAYQRSIRR